MGTRARQIERYHTTTGRPDLADPRVRRLVFRSFQRTVGPWLPPDRRSKILDAACGEGALLAFLRERGYTNLEGFDLSPECVAECHELGLTFVKAWDLLELADWPGEGYGVIFLMDIVEHLPKERAAEVLEAARGKLAPGGSLVIQTPNLGSLMGPYLRYHDLTHEFGLTEKSVRDLLALAGFRRERVDVRPAWNAATALGRAREVYLRLLHRLIFLAEDRSRPRIPTKNLLVRAARED
jgi:2-polyprenyl-3-methyl-5-hydroxy-6-metoxy-1,4-benzoquinol methylase